MPWEGSEDPPFTKDLGNSLVRGVLADLCKDSSLQVRNYGIKMGSLNSVRIMGVLGHQRSSGNTSLAERVCVCCNEWQNQRDQNGLIHRLLHLYADYGVPGAEKEAY